MHLFSSFAFVLELLLLLRTQSTLGAEKRTGTPDWRQFVPNELCESCIRASLFHRSSLASGLSFVLRPLLPIPEEEEHSSADLNSLQNSRSSSRSSLSEHRSRQGTNSPGPKRLYKRSSLFQKITNLRRGQKNTAPSPKPENAVPSIDPKGEAYCEAKFRQIATGLWDDCKDECEFEVDSRSNAEKLFVPELAKYARDQVLMGYLRSELGYVKKDSNNWNSVPSSVAKEYQKAVIAAKADRDKCYPTVFKISRS